MAAQSHCRVDAVLKLIADRWTLGILHELSTGPRRTLDLHGRFQGLSTKTMAERLKKLLRQGLIIRKSYPESPPRVEYSLTEKGVRILPVIDILAQTFGLFYTATDDVSSCQACATLAGANSAMSPENARIWRAPDATKAEAVSGRDKPLDDEMMPVRTTIVPAGPDGKGKKKRTDVTLL
jgi:DNA-binding HxlR family transcriptional regulator